MHTWICHGITSIPVYRTKHTLEFKKSNLAVLAFKKNSTHPNWKQLKPSPVLESSTHPLQNYTCFFPLTSGPGSYAHKPASCHCPYIQTSTTMAWGCKRHAPFFYSAFARQPYDDTRVPGWLLAVPAHSQCSSPLQQPFHTQIADYHIQQLGKLF